MLEVYCDESVVEMFGKETLFLAGYLAPSENWHAFTAEWREQILERFAVPYLHAVELRSFRKSVYKHLDLTTRRELLSRACDIIVRHVDAGFVNYIRPSDLMFLTKAVERARWGGVYGICAELLVGNVSRHVDRPERVYIYFEDGHANVGSALLRVAGIKADTEPIEWPEMPDMDRPEGPDFIEQEMRTSWMRIGEIDKVKKTESLPTQAADLLAYLAATAMRNDDDPVYAGCLDLLLGRRPHSIPSLDLERLSEIVDVTRSVEKQRSVHRQNIFEMRGKMHALGYTTHLLPWGLVVDKGPRDEQSNLLKQRVEEIMKEF